MSTGPLPVPYLGGAHELGEGVGGASFGALAQLTEGGMEGRLGKRQKQKQVTLSSRPRGGLP